jgi:cytochrome c oxidase subunit 2
MTLLVLAVIVLFVIAATRVMNIYNLSAELRGGRKDDVITEAEGRNQATLWVLFLVAFLGFCLWQVIKYKDKLLPEAASAHGPEIDNLFNVTLAVIAFVFVLTHIVLVYQLYKNVSIKGRKAVYFAHSNKLEMIWTIIPAIVLSGLIAYGLTVWGDVIYAGAKDAQVIELYSKQFDWTARYAGKDNTLGKSDFRSIGDGNDLGMVADKNGDDDIIVKGEFHIVKDKPVNFKFRSRDVIHSAFMPHFRAQMNCVPGMETSFEFTPTITTKEMREKLNNKKFNYILLCNKICGAAHYNMQMDIIVETQEEYNTWISEQQTWTQKQASAAPAPAANSASEITAPADTSKIIVTSEPTAQVTVSDTKH